MKRLFKAPAVLLLLFCCCAAAVVRGAPKIPCTFSCEYRETYASRATANDATTTRRLAAKSNIAALSSSTSSFSAAVRDYDERLMWYHVEGKRANQDGISDNITFIWAAPTTFTLVSPFFERRTCVKMVRTDVAPPHCPEFPEDAKLYKTDVPCPTDKTKLCDDWQWHDSEWDTVEDGYFLKGTNIPMQIYIDTEEYSLTEEFIGFNASEPDASHFQPAPTQQCTDLTDDDGGADFSEELVNSPRMVERINRFATTWKPAAEPPLAFRGLTYGSARKLLRSPIPFSRSRRVLQSSSATDTAVLSKIRVPEAFDSRINWPTCKTIAGIRDQGNCGSCWAFGATEAFSDRFCVVSNTSVLFSPQYLVSCSTKNDGCMGGYLDEAWYFLRDTGVVTDTCLPYTAEKGKCPYGCNSSSEPLKLYRSKNAYSTFVNQDFAANVLAIQQEILQNGPVEAAFYVLEDFYSYSSGVYVHTKGSALAGGHAIKLVGWGVDAETKLPFWTVANSWGTKWGENGFFRILRGKNECGIESEVASGIPVVA